MESGDTTETCFRCQPPDGNIEYNKKNILPLQSIQTPSKAPVNRLWRQNVLSTIGGATGRCNKIYLLNLFDTHVCGLGNGTLFTRNIIIYRNTYWHSFFFIKLVCTWISHTFEWRKHKLLKRTRSTGCYFSWLRVNSTSVDPLILLLPPLVLMDIIRAI